MPFVVAIMLNIFFYVQGRYIIGHTVNTFMSSLNQSKNVSFIHTHSIHQHAFNPMTVQDHFPLPTPNDMKQGQIKNKDYHSKFCVTNTSKVFKGFVQFHNYTLQSAELSPLTQNVLLFFTPMSVACATESILASWLW